MSVYVTFTFVVAVALWLLALIAQRNWTETTMFVGAGAVAALWALPFLSSLRGPAGGSDFAEFALRPFPVGLRIAQQIGIHIQTQSAVTLFDAIFLPINYALELGFFLAIGVMRLRQLRRGKVEADPKRTGCLDAGRDQFPDRHLSAFGNHRYERPGMEMFLPGSADPAAVGGNHGA